MADPPRLWLALSPIGSSADGPPLPLRGKGRRYSASE
jgi:hypothetical protein